MADLIAKDIKFTDDIVFDKGDFVLEESDDTHIENILKANKGYFFETPLIGVGIIKELKGSKSRQQLKQDIRRNLMLDNFSVEKIEFQVNKISIAAKRLK